MENTEKVFEILRELGGEKEIKLSSNLRSDLLLDSLMMVTLIIEIEDTFGIELDESDMNPLGLENVEDVVDLVNRYCDRCEK